MRRFLLVVSVGLLLSSCTAKEIGVTPLKVDERVFRVTDNDGTDPGQTMLLKMKRSQTAVRALSRVALRWTFVDWSGVEHTIREM